MTALYSQESDEAIYHFTEITRPSWSTAERIVNSNSNVVKGGETYIGYPHVIGFPDEEEQTEPKLNFIALNLVDPETGESLVGKLRGSSEQIFVTVRWTLWSTPEVTEIELSGELKLLRFDEEFLSGEVTPFGTTENALQHITITPSRFPGAFG